MQTFGMLALKPEGIELDFAATAQWILNFFAGLSLEQAAFYLLIQNILQYVLCLAAGHLLIMMFSSRRIAPAPAPLEQKEIWLSISCIFLNTAVAVIGFQLWKAGIIVIHTSSNALSVVTDVMCLLLLMDLLMYLTHRICHIPFIYPWVHKTHHLYDNPRPLSLFVLNPLEVFGFGFLWLAVIAFYHSSWLGIVIYLLMNAAWGTLGHLGVEPMPDYWTRIPVLGRLTTSRFHAEHHQLKEKNYGFYTDVWDSLFKSISEGYRKQGK